MVRLWALVLVALIGGAASAAPTTTDLLALKDVLAPSLSPDGRYVAYRIDQADVTANRRTASWWIAPTDRSEPPRRVSDGGIAIWQSSGGAVIEAPTWAPDGKAFYFRALIGGAVQVWRSPIEGGQAAPITDDAADVRSFQLSADKRGIDYVVGATRAEIVKAERESNDAGVVVDDRVDLRQALFDAVEINGRLASQRLTGRWVQRGGLLDSAPNKVWRVDLAGAGRVPSPGSPLVDTRRSSDGFWTVPSSGPFRAEATTSGQTHVCDQPACQGPGVQFVGWRPGAAEIIFVATDSLKRQTLFIWSLANSQVYKLYGGTGQLVDALNPSCSIGARMMVCVETAAALPPRLVSLDLRSGASAVLDAPNAKLSFNDVEVRPLTWTANGRDFAAYLILPRPASSRPRPLFIYYYYCDGFLRGGEGDIFPLYPIATAGIATLCINRSPPLPNEDAVAEYQTALAGITAIVDRLAGDGLVERERVAMGGFSFGSEITMWVATHSDLLAAAMINSSQLEASYYWYNGVRGRDSHAMLKAHWGLGAPDEDPASWRRVAPAQNVAAISAPILMQLPEQEARGTMELFARLSVSTTPAELVAFANEPHILTQPRHRLAAYERSLDWLRFWLQDRVDEAPAKAVQFDRWRALRDRWTAPSRSEPPRPAPMPPGP